MSDVVAEEKPDEHGYLGPKVEGYREGSKGKEFNTKGILRYEGDWKMGVRAGRGSQYDRNGQLVYFGDFKSNLKHGSGKEFNEQGVMVYEGSFVNGMRNLEGKLYDDEGILRYEGMFLNGVRNGKGQTFCKEDYTYRGIWQNATELIPDIIEYEGRHKEGQPHGYGVEYDVIKLRKTFVQGDVMFEGEFKNGLRHGKGTEYPYGKAKYVKACNEQSTELSSLCSEAWWVNGSPPAETQSGAASIEGGDESV
jgi:antitoxin component YwqK of YwqJK toxin-antitoxin module